MIYLLHFDAPISPNHTTQHYLGYALDPTKRLEAHRSGTGSRLCAVANERGISYRIVRLWTGDRQTERQLKNRKNARLLCPVCSNRPLIQLELPFDDGDDIWPNAPWNVNRMCWAEIQSKRQHRQVQPVDLELLEQSLWI